MERIKNSDLQCKDCIYRYNDSIIMGNTSICAKYEEKPAKVLLKSGECPLYRKEADHGKGSK